MTGCTAVSIVDAFEAPGDAERAAIVINLIRDYLPTLRGHRFLDLGCRTGSITRAIAAAGGNAVGIEGKEGNYAKIPNTPRTLFHRDDVRNLSVEKYGLFDITLCLGLLYHLEADAAIKLLENMRRVTRRLAIIDTHVAVGLEPPVATTTVNQFEYQGRFYDEGSPSLWSSLGNQQAWWFTEGSLMKACNDAGWSGVSFLEDVAWSGQEEDRRWLLLS